jgi:hypothetical protein
MRKISPNKKTLDVWKTDCDVIDAVRQTDIGKVSFADATHQVVKAYLYCKENNIDFTKKKEEV